MKKLLIVLMCFTAFVEADTTFKIKVCNYTLGDMSWEIEKAYSVKINDKEYPKKTDGNIANGPIRAIQCQEIPVISTITVDNASPYVGIQFSSIVGASRMHTTLMNLQDKPRIEDPKAIVKSFTLLMNSVNSPFYKIFLHAENEFSIPLINYYDITTIMQGNSEAYNKMFNNLVGEEDFEFYICDSHQVTPCNGTII